MSFDYKVIESYYRQAHFDFFSAYDSPFFCLTFDLEITSVREFARTHGYSTYFNLCYLMTEAMQGIEDFRYRILDDRIVLYEQLHFRSAVPTADAPFAFARFEFQDDIHQANAAAVEIVEQARRELYLEEEPRHANFVFYSALPEVPFTSLTHVPSDNPNDSQPKVTFGKFVEREGRLYAPLGIQVNHIFIDGGALGELYRAASELMSSVAGR